MKLKPCPFCGGEGVMHMAEYPPKNVQYKKEIPKGARLIRFAMFPSGTAFYEFREKAFIPQCSDSKCVGRSTKMFTTEDEAVEAWNRRVNDGKID